MQTQTQSSESAGKRIERLAGLGVDVEELLEHMDSQDLREVFRGTTMESLANLGVDIEGLLEHMDSEDKREVMRDMLGL
jgi:4'-phosphopantetheinyl transferase EntD